MLITFLLVMTFHELLVVAIGNIIVESEFARENHGCQLKNHEKATLSASCPDAKTNATPEAAAAVVTSKVGDSSRPVKRRTKASSRKV